VRTLVATLVQVGSLRMTVESFRGILAARQRGLTPAPAPAVGLTLRKVTYDPDLLIGADTNPALVEE
jgi:tRNA pseudouridine38-40 synthase